MREKPSYLTVATGDFDPQRHDDILLLAKTIFTNNSATSFNETITDVATLLLLIRLCKTFMFHSVLKLPDSFRLKQSSFLCESLQYIQTVLNIIFTFFQ